MFCTSTIHLKCAKHGRLSVCKFPSFSRRVSTRPLQMQIQKQFRLPTYQKIFSNFVPINPTSPSMTSYSLKRAHFHWLFALALLLIPAAAPAKNLDSLLNVLDKCLLERDIYETQKTRKPNSSRSWPQRRKTRQRP